MMDAKDTAALRALDSLLFRHIKTVTEMGEDAHWIARHDIENGKPTGRAQWIARYENHPTVRAARALLTPKEATDA